jgi:tRNA-uridine 2-sulfurtransferase
MKTPSKEIIVALSGGVDSAVAAAVLIEQGWRVLGVHLRLTEKLAEMQALQSLCQYLGIDCLELDFRREFASRVIRYFAASYKAGRTPNPCVRCNEQIKFGLLLQVVRSWGCKYLATGHYARIESGSDGATALFRGFDPYKDQSYFLHRLKASILDWIQFPLGRWTKNQVLEKSRSLGLEAYLPSRESQELCFITGKYGDFMKQLGIEGLDRPGPIINRQGQVLGRHRGLEHYTIGQRQGLGVPAAAPYYVLEIYPELNQLIVGFKEELHAAALEVKQINWLVPPPAEPLRAQVRLRYRHPGVGCLITPTGPQMATIILDQPQTAIAPGQAAVFYQQDQVLGGGWITRGLV